MAVTTTGRVKVFNQEDQTGYLTTPNGDVRFHIDSVSIEDQPKIKEGVIVTADIVASGRGDIARKVKIFVASTSLEQ